MKLTVASSPHIRGNFRTNRIMADVMIALVPALAVGVVRFGFQALLLTLVCMASASAPEAYLPAPELIAECQASTAERKDALKALKGESTLADDIMESILDSVTDMLTGK